MITVLTVSALRWMERHRRRAALRRLLAYDDATLEDIGVPRATIERALRLPPDVDPDQAGLKPSRPRPSPGCGPGRPAGR
jgi:uncharacterized protein YjiS (DUF1127 family)